MTKIVFLGEAWGKDESQMEYPFVGKAGQELWRMLHDAGFPCDPLPYNFISPFSMYKRWQEHSFTLLNVFNERPPDPENKNRVEYFYGHPSDKSLKLALDLPSRRIGQRKMYIFDRYRDHLLKLDDDLKRIKPNLIVALGNTPCWALGLPVSIGKYRGSITTCKYGKVLPIYHPAAVLRNWSFRIISVIDFLKAKREGEYPDIKTQERFIWTEPSIKDLYKWWDLHGSKAKLLTVDIETLRDSQISEIGFAASPTQALHIPFFYEEQAGGVKRYVNWWKTLPEEVEAWRFTKMVCESPIPKIGQNIIQYDVYWLIKEMGIKVNNIREDTMVKSHCWQLELDKNLGFLGSIFLDERSWKGIRKDVAKGED